MSEWQNVRTVSGEFGEVTFVGHLLASDEEIRSAGRQFADSADPKPLADLAGNYSGIIRSREEVIAFGGLSGQFQTCYAYTGTSDEGAKLLVGTRSSMIAKQIGAGLDRATLGALVGLPMGVLRDGYSVFEGVHEVKSGEFIRWNPRQGLSHETYETFAPDPGGSLDDAVFATRTGIQESLERRFNMLPDTTHKTTDSSGGYDSTALAFKTASLSDSNIPAFILYHPDYPAGDIRHARRLSRLDPRIDLRELVEGDEQLPYSIFSGERIPFSEDEPYRTASIFGRQLLRVEAARAAGSTMHLTGTGGDALYDSQPFLADVLTRDSRRFSEDSIRLARRDLCPPEHYEGRAYRHAATSLGQAWEQLAGVLGNPEKRYGFDVGWLPLLDRNVEWLTPEVRKLLQERALAAAQMAQTDMSIGDYWTISQIRDSGDAQRHLMRLEGKNVHAPLLDNGVIRAALHCNAYDRTQPGRQFKPVLKLALSGHGVPAQLFERSDKGSYDLVNSVGLRRSIRELSELMLHSRLAALDIINPDAVLESLYNQESDGRGKAQFAWVMALETWLRQREEFLGEYHGKLPFSVAAPVVETPRSPEPEEPLTGKYVPISSLVCAAGPDGELLAFDILTDNRINLNQTSALVFRTLNQSGSPEDAVRQLSSRHSTVPLQRLRHDVAAVVAGLTAAGFLTQAGADSHRPLTIPEWVPPSLDEESAVAAVGRLHELAAAEQIKLAPEERQMGHQALDLACKLTEQGFVSTRQYLEEAQRRVVTPATHAEALRYLLIARQLSYDPAYTKYNIACYQLSLAVATMAATHNKAVDWVMGVAFGAKTILHVWVEVDEQPVLTSLDTPVERFQELYRIARSADK